MSIKMAIGSEGLPAKEEFWVHCGDCQHSWVAFYTPIKLSLVSRFGKLACPTCASKKIFCSKGEK